MSEYDKGYYARRAAEEAELAARVGGLDAGLALLAANGDGGAADRLAILVEDEAVERARGGLRVKR